MATQETKERSKRNLVLPETGRIAALLADLMPGVAPATESESDDTEPINSSVAVDIEPPVTEILPPEIFATAPAASTKRVPQDIDAAVVELQPTLKNDSGWDSGRCDPDKNLIPDTLLVTALPWGAHAETDFQVSEVAASDVLTDRIEVANPSQSAPAVDAPAPVSVADDRIPLGELTTAAYFALVNWQNRPDRGRHPRLSDFGLDDASLALAKVIPFYVVGQPRVADKTTVAAVLSEVAWE
jgi:hypothetical protein